MNTFDYNALLHVAKEVAVETKKIQVATLNVAKALDDYINTVERRMVLNQQREI